MRSKREYSPALNSLKFRTNRVQSNHKLKTNNILTAVSRNQNLGRNNQHLVYSLVIRVTKKTRGKVIRSKIRNIKNTWCHSKVIKRDQVHFKVELIEKGKLLLSNQREKNYLKILTHRKLQIVIWARSKFQKELPLQQQDRHLNLLCKWSHSISIHLNPLIL